jgi:high-affinity iron transporter
MFRHRSLVRFIISLVAIILLTAFSPISIQISNKVESSALDVSVITNNWLPAKSVADIQPIQGAPIAVIGSAGILVFREGLEAVIILASLMGSMKAGTSRKYRRPMWLGGGLGFLATVATFFIVQSVMTSLEHFSEQLEAVVSMVAIGTLLLVTNWFFHKTYWTDWITSMQSRKKRLFSGETGLILGLVSLGFATVYREGFETVLFLQALMLESGLLYVLGGILAGLAATFLVGFITFKLNARVPYKQMLAVTGILIGGVLLVMVGKTVHVLQEIGWLPATLISLISLPLWLGTWFGAYSTWQGVVLQAAAACFVIGSYYLAAARRKRKSKADSDVDEGQHKDEHLVSLEKNTGVG